MLIQNVNFRDCDAWRKEGLQMNTTSNEACKLYDIVLSQHVGWYENEIYGGFDASINNMVNADENFVLGRVLKLGIELIGSSSYLADKYYFNSVNDLITLSSSKNQCLSKREQNHVEAIKHLYDGNINVACDYWERILIENPTDLMALKFAHDAYFYTGSHAQMRDSVGRVMPYWNSSLSMYSYLYGMHSFGLAQTNFFVEAEKAAKKSLELNKNDAWATHTLCHVFEYKNDYDTGIRFLRDTEKDWNQCSFIATHNYWHLSLYHIEKNEHQQALDIFDENISAYLSANRTLDLVDLASLLYRLKLGKLRNF
jgi:tetratricopeptide (TPR) repeat protein